MIYDYENDDKYIICDVGNIGDMDEYIVSNGDLISNWKDVKFEYNPIEGDIFSDYVANIYRWLIISNRFQMETQKLISNSVQYLPIRILDSVNGNENSSYCVVNILDILDALDLNNSKYDVFELEDEKIVSIEKYALKKTKIQGHHIFRLKDDTIPIFVSEEIKKIVEEKALSGFAFVEVQVV